MKALPHLLKKEFRQIRRNKAMLPIIFIMPFVQLLILVNAADFEIRNIRIAFEDADRSKASQQLIARFTSSPYFNVLGMVNSATEGLSLLDRDKVTVVLRIPNGFERQLQSNHHTTLALDINGIDGQAAGLSRAYVGSIVREFQASITSRGQVGRGQASSGIDERYWYNSDLEYRNMMLPGLLVLLVTMVGLFLTSMNIVREIEMGTIEQINVTPIRKYEFIIGKLLPFWIIGLLELALGLTIGVLVYSIPIVGSVWLLFLFAMLYLPVIMGMGLIVSSITKTQQQAMFVSWFLMVIFLLMSGLFTPIENMPQWAQSITLFNPTAYFIKVVRLVLLKGSSLMDVAHEFGVITLFSIVMTTIAVLAYRKRVA
ncbi:MAG: ABC transporter permease [Ignavibacteria bacterium]|nr:ABC transporter permease [Ignavibacteria bacterium]